MKKGTNITELPKGELLARDGTTDIAYFKECLDKATAALPEMMCTGCGETWPLDEHAGLYVCGCERRFWKGENGYLPGNTNSYYCSKTQTVRFWNPLTNRPTDED